METFHEKVAELERLAFAGDAEGLRDMLCEVVPTYVREGKAGDAVAVNMPQQAPDNGKSAEHPQTQP